MTEWIKMTLRLPRELHRALGDLGEANNRSLNNEIVTRLEASFREAKETFQNEPDSVQIRLERLEQQVAELQQALSLSDDKETEAPSQKLLRNIPQV